MKNKEILRRSITTMTELSEQKTNDRVKRFFPPTVDENMFTRLLIEVKFYENKYAVLPCSNQIPSALHESIHSFSMTKIGNVK